MNNLEILKQELLSQKELIERRGGVVVVSGNNPSPAEITEGIKTISGSDLSIATATEQDVRLGKTFYAGSPDLKTGSANMDVDGIKHVFMFNSNEQTWDDVIYFTCPDHIKAIKDRMFDSNINKVSITFSENITSIGSYAFRNAKNFSFGNFSNLNALTNIGQYAFSNSGCDGIDFSNLPNSITRIDTNAFENGVKENQSIKLPENLTVLGDGAFKQIGRVVLSNFNCSNTKITSLSNSACYYLAFNCDLIIPTNFIAVMNQFNYNGCFRNIIVPDNIRLYENAFGAATYRPVSDFFLQSVVFEGENVLVLGSNVFAQQNITNGFKIYVPDTAIEEYKALSNLSRFVDCIYPMSQKE